MFYLQYTRPIIIQTRAKLHHVAVELLLQIHIGPYMLKFLFVLELMPMFLTRSDLIINGICVKVPWGVIPRCIVYNRGGQLVELRKPHITWQLWQNPCINQTKYIFNILWLIISADPIKVLS
jgi:hypothetical protein